GVVVRRALDRDGETGPVGERRQVERLEVRGRRARRPGDIALGGEVGGVRRWIDHRRSGDADLRGQVTAAAGEVGGVPWRTQGAVHDLRARGRVEDVDVVVLGHDQQAAGEEERLGVDLSVEGDVEQLLEG